MGQQGVLSKDRSFGLFLHTVPTVVNFLWRSFVPRAFHVKKVLHVIVCLWRQVVIWSTVCLSWFFFRLCPSNFACEDLHISGTACIGITGCPDFNIWQGYFAWIVWRSNNLWTGSGLYINGSFYPFFLNVTVFCILAWQVSLTSNRMILKIAQWYSNPMSVVFNPCILQQTLVYLLNLSCQLILWIVV